MGGRGRQAEEAGDVKADEADEAYEANETNEADKADLADEATNATETTKADEADVADEIVTANDAAANKLPIDNEHVIDSIIIYFLFGWRPFSLTKYCAIFLKDKGYFCPITHNNQFGIGSGISCFRVASEFESQYNNLLEADNAEANESNEAEADEADEAIAADETDAVEADKDDDANEVGLANEADVEAISTDDAVLDEAKADEANEADKADTEANDAIEAIVTEEIEVNVIDEIVAADEAIVIDEVIARHHFGRCGQPGH